MSLTGILRTALLLRLFVATLIFWILSSTQSMAWQNGRYNPYPNYNAPPNYNPYARPYGYPVYNYQANNYPRYYSRPYYQPPNYYAPQILPTRPVQPVTKPELKKKLRKKSIINQNTVTSKKLFTDKLLPYIDKENKRLIKLRQRIVQTYQQLDTHGSLSEKSETWLKKLAKKYRVKDKPILNLQARDQLLSKVDIIPSSLTLAQAANESAWGKSRFATEANNLFGIWTYDKNKGLKPRDRDSNQKHLVRVFEHYGESVSYYMHTLNSHPAYAKLRNIRQQQRKNRLVPDGFEMADGLEKYSAKGQLYIKLIRDLIRQNQWAQLDRQNLFA